MDAATTSEMEDGFAASGYPMDTMATERLLLARREMFGPHTVRQWLGDFLECRVVAAFRMPFFFCFNLHSGWLVLERAVVIS